MRMNTIAYSFSYIVVVLIVYVSSTDHLLSDNINTVNAPYNFSFSSYYHFLQSEITLKNIPPSVTKIFLLYSGNYNFDLRVPGKILQIIIVDKEIKNGEVTIPFPRSLETYQHIMIDVELETSKGLCTKSRVAEGRHTASVNYWDYTIRKIVYWNTNWTYDSTGSCLKPEKCEIVLDFHNQCEEKFSCDYNATKFTCTLHHDMLKNPVPYQLYQVYNSEPFIAIRLSTAATNIKLIIELESFDNNTSVNVAKSNNKSDIIWSNKIFLTAKYVVKNKFVGILNYSESTDINYNCEEYISPPKLGKAKGFSKAFTGLINTKENGIISLGKITKNKNRIKKEHNGSILCCLYYSHETTADRKDLLITRVVANKTLLIYQPKELTFPKAYNSEDTKDLAMSSAPSKDYRWMVYVLAPIIGVSVLMLLGLYFISKQGWLTKSRPVEETIELDNTQQNQVLYADLDFVKNANHQIQNQREESHYATIVGELHPH